MERQTPVHSDLVTTPGSHRRSGFTLVELLAVIMIIALLAGLVTPAVMRSMSSARVAAVKVEVDLLHNALMNYRQEYGAFPPADMRGLWNGNTDTVNTAHPVFKHLQRAFPRLNEPGLTTATAPNQSPYYYMAQMSPAQALVFWLQGFYDNPAYPLTNGQPLSATVVRTGDANGSRKKLFDFDDTRLYSATPYFSPVLNANWSGPQSFAGRNNTTGYVREYPVYFPKMPNASVPYVYFPSTTYSAGPSGPVTTAISSFGANPPVFYYHAQGINGDATYASPYFYSNPPSQPSFAQLHPNPDTFQLIAAGADGVYAAADTKVACFPEGTSAFTFNSQSVGPLPSVADATGNEDNITNFASGPLKNAAEKLLNQ
jgi:prepilin-type N-terminal cleavage/methylation domain-containing protein